MQRTRPDFTPEQLQIAWAQSRDNTRDPGRPGIDRLSAAMFAAELPENLAVMSRRIRRGEYNFSPLYPAFIRKKSGRLRLICVPTVRDRLIQRAIKVYLEDKDRLDLSNTISYGFLRGRGVVAAIAQACALRQSAPFAVKVDITAFFDSIDRDRLYDIINRRVGSRRVRELLRGVVGMEVLAQSRTAKRQLKDVGVKRGTGLRQGMPLSPLLSNLYLKRFDQDVAKDGVPAVRYADDILAFGRSYGEAEEIFDRVRSALMLFDLNLPDLGDGDKASVICGPRESVEYLGMDIRATGSGEFRPCVPKRKLEQVIADLEEIASVAVCVANRQTLGTVSRSLDSIVAGLEGAMRHAYGYDRFIARVVRAKEAAIAKLVSELIGPVAFDSLTDDGKRVLGLAPF